MNFTFDPRKAATNTRKHGVTFEEASTAFFDPLHAVFPDDLHSFDEERLILIGQASTGRFLFIVYTEIASTVRLISARVATATERANYEES